MTPGWIEELRRSEGLPRRYATSVVDYLAPLAGRIRQLRQRLGRPVAIGISGAQGSGKTTLARFLGDWLRREDGLACACLSLDDCYLDRTTRAALARERHPLLAIRGVPGTHDIALARRLLTELTRPGTRKTILLPVFDKARDDRLPATRWNPVDAPVDVVLLEGWCVGCRPQEAASLAVPVNHLERREDPEGGWRRYVNHRLGTDYAELFARLDDLVFLRVPSFARVRKWRGLQERKLRRRIERGGVCTGPIAVQTNAQLARFILHFERLTRHMLETVPQEAGTVIDVGDDHGLAEMSHPRRDR